MTIVAILQYPDQRLKREAVWVDPAKIPSPEIQKVIDDMFETHYAADNCAALAATQLDLDPAYRITVIDFSEKKDEPLCLINPKILESKGAHEEEEGCMSVYPKVAQEKVKRATWIRVSFLDREGKEQELSVDGFMAKCMQHEIDHLDGKVYLDRLSSLKRQRLIEKSKKISEKIKRSKEL
jgi:peptide deformylase